MPRVRFKKAFKYSPDGKSTTVAQRGDEADVSEAVAKSILMTESGVLIDEPEEATDPTADEVEAARAKALEDEKAAAADSAGAGKTGPSEDKSVKPADDKADSEE